MPLQNLRKILGNWELMVKKTWRNWRVLFYPCNSRYKKINWIIELTYMDRWRLLKVNWKLKWNKIILQLSLASSFCKNIRGDSKKRKNAIPAPISKKRCVDYVKMLQCDYNAGEEAAIKRVVYEGKSTFIAGPAGTIYSILPDLIL